MRGRTWGRWLRRRGPVYLARRARALVGRYGVTPRRAEARTLRFVDLLAAHGCAPTLATPGQVVRRNAAFARELQARGVELAVHGYEHVDFRDLTDDERRDQFERALAAYDAAGIRASGFRCPYLGWTDDMRSSVPEALRYSSNHAYAWPVVDAPERAGATAVLATLDRFYHAGDVATARVVPTTRDGLLEIPVSVPDDLQLLDGLHRSADAVGEAWSEMLRGAHARGEIFVLLAHPELADECAPAFEAVLATARAATPSVWVARLDDVARWWQERATFAATFDGERVRVRRPARATVLVRNVPGAHGPLWHDGFRALHADAFPAGPDRLPFVGLAPDVGPAIDAALTEEGFVVRRGEDAGACATVLAGPRVRDLGTEAALVAHLERSDAPLVRCWRWPSGARGALCITGDLDALSLYDYASRLVPTGGGQAAKR